MTTTAGALQSAGTTTTTAVGAVKDSNPLNVPSDIKDLSLDEVVNKWTDEIGELTAHFQKGASLVSRWDRAIVSNEDKIQALHKDSQSLQVAHTELTNNLDVILSQQSELHSLLDALEVDVKRKIGTTNGTRTENGGGIISGMGVIRGGAKVQGDVERESMHRLSVEVMEELDAMALTIRELVGELNKGRDAAGVDGGAGGDIVAQIISVLNAHLDSLQYLDESSSSLQKRLTDVSRAVEVVSRESERMFARRTGGMY